MISLEQEVESDDIDDMALEGLTEGGNSQEREELPKKQRFNFVVVGLIVSILGLSLVLFVVYVFGFTTLKQERAQRQLLNVFTTPAGAVPLSGQLPPDGSPAAILKIPAIGVNQVVVQGTTARQTALGPGLMTQAARPGTIGNAVILGRRTTSGAPFRNLGLLHEGEAFQVISGLGSFNYIVIQTGVVQAGAQDPASPVNRAQVTLMTSGDANGTAGSLYVVGRQTNAPGAAKKPKYQPASYERGLSGDPSAIPASILLGLVYCAGIVFTVLAYRRYRQSLWTVYVLSTPILLALAFWWFENLYLLLPSTM